MEKLKLDWTWFWGVVGGLLSLVLMGALSSLNCLAGVVVFLIGPYFFVMALLSRTFNGEGPFSNILYLALIFLYYGGLTYFLILFFKNKKWKWFFALLAGYLAFHTATILWLIHVMSGLRGL